jgi:AraC family transcriptional regulator of adaptative response / DNA-3-methyladenine glycosylase II
LCQRCGRSPASTLALDRARISRDPRFDGKFFIAVTSTGIYCRPICPVCSPKRVHIRYYLDRGSRGRSRLPSLLALPAGGRPGSLAWLGTSAIVVRSG